MSKIVVCRPVGGITINSEMEFVLDNEGGVCVFDNMEYAKKVLWDAGCTNEEMEHMKFLESCGTCVRCKSPLFPSLLPYPPTPASWPWHSPVLGHIKFAIPRGLSSQ